MSVSDAMADRAMTSTQPPPPRIRQMPLLVLDLSGHDRWRSVTIIAIVGVIVAGLLAMFGMPPVDMHGPNHQLGFMVPTCGLTRGLAAAARLDLGRSVAFNPLAPLMLVGAVATLARAVAGAVTGRWIDMWTGRPRFWAGLGAVTFVALWINQQAHAALLMGP